MLIHAFAGDVLERRARSSRCASARERRSSTQLAQAISRRSTRRDAMTSASRRSRAAFDVATVRADFPILSAARPRQAARLSRQRGDDAEAAARCSTRSRRTTPAINANVHRGVAPAERAGDRRLRRRRASACGGSSTPPRSREIVFTAERHRRHQPGRADLRRSRTLTAGRRGADLRDGAPLEHRAVAAGLRGRRARVCASCRSTTAASSSSTSSSGC